MVWVDRVAGAPISWGVCEVPDWGHQLPPEQVLAEMRGLGLRATEFGPAGFLPDDPAARAAYLADYGLRAVGGFLPLLLHDPRHDPLPEVDAFLDGCLAAGADVMVLAAATGVDGYDGRPELGDVGWTTLNARLDEIDARATARGVVAAVHPHVGTMVEDAADVARVLAGSGVGLCIDTGHLVAAGADPVAITRAHPERVRHVHLKDVDAALAPRVVAGEIAFSDAVSQGLWTVLGMGSADVAAMISALERSGYEGWYVLEQDRRLSGPPSGEGPAADVRRCLDHVRSVLDAL